MSFGKPPEFFLDRSLGKRTARRLRAEGHIVHLIADHYPDDAQWIPDDRWIEDGCRRGWVLLTKDKRIRYRRIELEALDGYLFCLAGGNLSLDEMSEHLIAAMPRIVRAVSAGEAGFWHVYAAGQARRMWP